MKNRRELLLGGVAALGIAAAPSFAGTPSVLRDAGDVRRLKMYNGQTGESINTFYWIDGHYIPEALREVDRFMRDWRKNKYIRMDPANLDTLAAVHSLLDTAEPFQLISGYRTPATNKMLRRQNRNVAQNSLHIKGQAADIRIRGRSVSALAKAASACHSGGVGTYVRSDFVHVDCGLIRSWRVR